MSYRGKAESFHPYSFGLKFSCTLASLPKLSACTLIVFESGQLFCLIDFCSTRDDLAYGMYFPKVIITGGRISHTSLHQTPVNSHAHLIQELRFRENSHATLHSLQLSSLTCLPLLSVFDIIIFFISNSFWISTFHTLYAGHKTKFFLQ